MGEKLIPILSHISSLKATTVNFSICVFSQFLLNIHLYIHNSDLKYIKSDELGEKNPTYRSDIYQKHTPKGWGGRRGKKS